MTSIKQEVKDELLYPLWDLCYRAHSNVSFSPERRANSYVREYSQMLQEDLQELGDKAGNYQSKFVTKFTDWMGAKSRCISSMITGPANFPVRKAEKSNRAEMNKYNDFMHWRSKYFKAVNRKKTPSPEQDLEDAMKKLDELVIRQENMKGINKIMRRVMKKDFLWHDLVEELKKEEFPAVMIEYAIQNEGWWGYGYAPFELTNNNNKIKRNREKIQIMNSRILRKNTMKDIEFEGGRITIEDDRVKIFHDEKPEREIIDEIKRNGFRWSRFWKCWCRKHTANAINRARSLSFVND